MTSAYPYGPATEPEHYAGALHRVRGVMSDMPPQGWRVLAPQEWEWSAEAPQLGQVDFLPAAWTPPTWGQWTIPAIVGAAVGASLFWFFSAD